MIRKEKPTLGVEPRTSALRKLCSAIELGLRKHVGQAFQPVQPSSWSEMTDWKVGPTALASELVRTRSRQVNIGIRLPPVQGIAADFVVGRRQESNQRETAPLERRRAELFEQFERRFRRFD